MEPVDALPLDRHRYFHDGWMVHDTGRIYRVKVDDEGMLHGYNIQSGMRRRMPLVLDEMHPYYPEGQAFNHPVYAAMHIVRRPRQLVRRTASIQHYEVLWSARSIIIDSSIMEALMRHDMMPEYPSINDYRTWKHPTAISPTTIIQPRRDQDPTVIYMGSAIGSVVEGLFVPNDEEDVLTKLLRHEEVLCI